MTYLVAILAYLAALIVVGAVRSRQVRDEADFMVAGRRLGPWVLVGTLVATWIGSGSLFGAAGLAYEHGFSALWFDAGVWVAIIVLYFVAGRVRAFAQFTVPDILEARYNTAARVLGTVVTIIAYTAIVSYQIRAGGMVLEFVTGIPASTGMALTAVFVIGYTVLAGMISVAYTDVVNGVVMTAGLLLALPFLIDNAGGWESIRSALPATRFELFGELTVARALGYSVATMLLLLGEGGMYQRFFSARDERTARRAVLGWIAGTIVLECLVAVLAVAGSARFGGIDGEMVILHVVTEALPLAAGCLCLGAIVAVIVSTADSFLLVPATNITRDIYQRFIRPEASHRHLVTFSRTVVVILGLAAWLQVSFFSGVLEMAVYAYTMYGTGITPALMAAFFWKRANGAGAVTSMAAGMAVTLAWELAGQPGGVPTVYPALASSLACLVVVSLATRPPEESKWRALEGGRRR
ncbi:MAG: sodium:solute symporter family protein [Candidatus Glassbacteria bacterium]|nr:sodium:solute symporter family protein [Candidatus Glassbacteria bacterium]